MIKIAYVLPFLNIGGSEESVLNLCRLRNKKEFSPFIVALRDGPMREESRKEDIPVYIEPDIYTNPTHTIEILKTADIVNINCFAYEKRYEDHIYNTVQRARVPHLLTIRWKSKLPTLGCIKICVSNAVYDMQPDKENCVVIHNGVCLEKFNFEPKRDKENVVLTRICRPERCAPYFWLAMDKVLQLHANVEIRIVGGNGPSTERVKFLGVRRDIPDILAETDIFVYTPFPKDGAHDRVIIEAMAMGVPCVVSDVQAVNESIRDGLDGLLVPFGDVNAFVQAIDTLVVDRNMRKKSGMNALNRVRQNFNATTMVSRYEEIYRSILSSHEIV